MEDMKGLRRIKAVHMHIAKRLNLEEEVKIFAFGTSYGPQNTVIMYCVGHAVFYFFNFLITGNLKKRSITDTNVPLSFW